MTSQKSYVVDKYSRRGKHEISTNTIFQGFMDGDIHVIGWAKFILEGKIIGNLFIGPQAQGEINGAIKGTIICESSNPLYLNRNANIEGKVFCNTVKIHKNAKFQGEFTMGISDSDKNESNSN